MSDHDTEAQRALQSLVFHVKAAANQNQCATRRAMGALLAQCVPYLETLTAAPQAIAGSEQARDAAQAVELTDAEILSRPSAP
jgi:hypothetical protein